MFCYWWHSWRFCFNKCHHRHIFHVYKHAFYKLPLTETRNPSCSLHQINGGRKIFLSLALNATYLGSFVKIALSNFNLMIKITNHPETLIMYPMQLLVTAGSCGSTYLHKPTKWLYGLLWVNGTMIGLVFKKSTELKFKNKKTLLLNKLKTINS